LGKPVVFGANMQNFADIARIFLAKESVVQVRDAAELEKVLGELLADPQRRERLGRKAAEVVVENLGAVNRTVELIVEHLRQIDMYVVPPK
jgi:3-deoxy-D-manno-octulosonic-acid transferase